MHTAVFFDRDGIVNTRRVGAYVTKVSEFEFMEEFFPLFRWTKQRGFLTLVVSNQQGVGKGLMSEEDLDSITRYMQSRLVDECGAAFDGVYYCTDMEGSGSTRRKPEAGMFFEAAAQWHVDLRQSWMIGDTITDVIAGKRAGTHTILVSETDTHPDADFSVPSLRLCREVIESNTQSSTRYAVQ